MKTVVFAYHDMGCLGIEAHLICMVRCYQNIVVARR